MIADAEAVRARKCLPERLAFNTRWEGGNP